MLIEADASDFAALLAGVAPRQLSLVPDSMLVAPEVLVMLAALADKIRSEFAPAAWMVVEADEVVGLVSAVRPPADGELTLGYGVAPTRRGLKSK